jgi:hypothetical protein
MNQNVVKNLRNTRTNTEMRERLKDRQARLGDNYCEPCAKWEYGFSRKRCEDHNRKLCECELRNRQWDGWKCRTCGRRYEMEKPATLPTSGTN